MGGRLSCSLTLCWHQASQVFSGDHALRKTLDLEGLNQADPPAAVDPVVHLALADRRCQPLAKGGLGELVLLKVFAELHNHIMVYFNMWSQAQ